jgi:hypothetical protein
VHHSGRRHHWNTYNASGLFGMLRHLLSALQHRGWKVLVTAPITLADRDAFEQHKPAQYVYRFRFRKHWLHSTRTKVAAMRFVVVCHLIS